MLTAKTVTAARAAAKKKARAKSMRLMSRRCRPSALVGQNELIA